jgi:hypothetical protein
VKFPTGTCSLFTHQNAKYRLNSSIGQREEIADQYKVTHDAKSDDRAICKFGTLILEKGARPDASKTRRGKGRRHHQRTADS